MYCRLTEQTTGMEVGNFDDGSSYIKALEAALDMGSFNAYAQKVLNGPVVCSSSSSSSSSDSSSSSSEESDSDEDSDETDAGKYLLIHLFLYKIHLLLSNFKKKLNKSNSCTTFPVSVPIDNGLNRYS